MSLGLAVSAQAQFRSIPADVTGALQKQYPGASKVSWSDKLSYFQATFSLDTGGVFTARYGSKGEWRGTDEIITKDQIPATVLDGYSKSKYSGDWKDTGYTRVYLPAGGVQYKILIRKGSVQKKYLLFSDTGKMISDYTTL